MHSSLPSLGLEPKVASTSGGANKLTRSRSASPPISRTSSLASALPYMSLDLQPHNEYLGRWGKLRFFTNKKGLRIAQYFWPATSGARGQERVLLNPRAVIHLVHGHGGYLCHDYLKFYKAGRLHTYEGSWVQAMNEAGFSVCGVDNQGAGRSEGIRCYCDSLDDYVEDLVAGAQRACTLGIPGFPQAAPLQRPTPNGPSAGPADVSLQAVEDVPAVDEQAPEMPTLCRRSNPMGSPPALPHFIMGASLGGCLATVATLKHPELFRGTILLAAMLSLEKVSRQGLNPYLRPIGNLMSLLAPTLPCASASKNVVYPDLQVAYDADPNCWQGHTRARNAMEYLRWTGKLMAPGGMEQVTLPLLIFHGLNDDLCDSDGSKALYLRASSEDKTLKLLEGFWHVLTKEPGNEKVVAQIIEWVSERSPPLEPNPPLSAPISRATSNTQQPSQQTNGKDGGTEKGMEQVSRANVDVHAATSNGSVEFADANDGANGTDMQDATVTEAVAKPKRTSKKAKQQQKRLQQEQLADGDTSQAYGQQVQGC